MKRIALLSAVASVALATGAASPVRAQGFCANCAQEITQVASWVRQVADMANQLRVLQAQFDATARALETGNIVGALSSAAGLTHSYHPAANSVSRLFTGTNGTWGQGAAQFQGNNFYLPPTTGSGQSLAAEEAARRATATANAQAIALAGSQSIEEQIARLGVIEERLRTTTSVADAQLLTAEITAIRANIQANQARFSQVQMMLASAGQVNQQREVQIGMHSALTQAANTQWAVSSPWGGNIPAGFTAAGANGVGGLLTSASGAAYAGSSILGSGGSALSQAGMAINQANTGLNAAGRLATGIGSITGGW